MERSAEPIAEILTSASGFQVVVVEGPEPNLSLFRSITDQFIEANKPATFALPADAFVHTKADATVIITAKMADGRDLPQWVQFDARSGTFQMSPPQGFDEELQIKVTARDSEGREAAAIFKLTVGEGKPKPQGRISLSEQIILAANRSSSWLEALRSQSDKSLSGKPQVAPAAVRQPGRV
jgi:large repetitive protein